MSSTVVYLMRHSKPLKSIVYNKFKESNQISNEKQILSLEGEKICENLYDKKILPSFDEVYSSHYCRAISTAKYFIKDNNNINIDERFGERILGTEKKDEAFWLEQFNDLDAKAIDGESQKEVQKRMLDGINDIISYHKGKKILIVSHAVAISFLLMKWCELVEVKIEKKVRHFKFKTKTVINDSFSTPEIFKLKFNDNDLIDIKRIIIK